MVPSQGGGRGSDAQQHAVPPALARKLQQAITNIEESRKQRDRLILEALKLGCPLRAIADASGLTHARVAQIGKQHGWPPPEVAEGRTRAREEAKRANDELERIVSEYRRGGRKAD